jgi:four helix bundle protein
MQNFRNIQVWQKSYDLTRSIYMATKAFPPEEMYGLTSQLRRAALSIPCNIAEGCTRSTDADFARFLDMAIGSASEVECQLLLASDLGYLQRTEFDSLLKQVIDVKRMLAKFIVTLRKKNQKL